MLVFFLVPRLSGDFFRLAETTFFPHEKVIAEIPLTEFPNEQNKEVMPPRETRPPITYPKLFISEVMTGSSVSAQDEFVELYNPNDVAVSLTDWDIRRKSATGKESLFVSALRLKNKTIPPYRYFLIAHDGGYTGKVLSDALWPKSYSLSATKGALVLYNPAGIVSDEISWNMVPKDQSIIRASWDSAVFVVLSTPTPQNSQ